MPSAPPVAQRIPTTLPSLPAAGSHLYLDSLLFRTTFMGSHGPERRDHCLQRTYSRRSHRHYSSGNTRVLAGVLTREQQVHTPRREKHSLWRDCSWRMKRDTTQADLLKWLDGSLQRLEADLQATACTSY